jgi:hypothetical protein
MLVQGILQGAHTHALLATPDSIPAIAAAVGACLRHRPAQLHPACDDGSVVSVLAHLVALLTWLLTPLVR